MFTCRRCGYETSDRSNYKKHLYKKHVCCAKFEDVPIDQIRNEFETSKPLKEGFKCEYCNKEYGSRQGLYTHKKRCESEIEMLELQKKIKELEAKISSSNIANVTTTTINNIVNNITTNNVVNLRSFGDEDISHLQDDFLSHCLLNPTKGLPSLIEKIYYNHDMPCNQNLRFKSWKKNLFEKYIESEWKECDASNTLDELMRKGYRILNAHYAHNFMNDPDIIENEQHKYEYFRFLGDKKCPEYHVVKRDLRLLVKDKTMFLLAPPDIQHVSLDDIVPNNF